MAWCRLSLGEVEAARGDLERAGYTPSAGPAPEIAEARAIAQSGDVAGALAIVRPAVRRHALDPAAHALLADLLLIANPEDPAGPVEAFAVRVLAPNDALAWRRWGSIQLYRKRYLESLASFERYFKLAGLPGQGDTEAKQWVTEIKRALPGGDIAPEGLRE